MHYCYVTNYPNYNNQRNIFYYLIDVVPTKEPLSTVAEEVVIDKEKFEPVVENTDGDFIDDDFGLSIKKEWEHLRQQQLRIEEEVCFY